ncbi:MAG: hypothetical protein U9M90_04080 [Patescibacteria group bacterium]|nr:hypothetical protein [Patescibacteria group bacterium]
MTYSNNKVFFVLFVLFFLCGTICSSGQIAAQAQDQRNDQSLEISDERITNDNEAKAMASANDNVNSGETKVAELSKIQPQIFADAEAPPAGPAESVVIIAAITFGFLGAVIFLALVVHNRY